MRTTILSVAAATDPFKATMVVFGSLPETLGVAMATPGAMETSGAATGVLKTARNYLGQSAAVIRTLELLAHLKTTLRKAICKKMKNLLMSSRRLRDR